MPEGDAVLRTAQRLHAALAGQPLEVADLRWGRVDGTALVGATTIEVVSVGKHLLHRVSTKRTLHTHLRMDGQWRTLPRDEVSATQLRSPKLRARLETPTTAALGWQLGLIEVMPTALEQRVVGHLGPDLLGSDWGEDRALHNLRSQPTRPIAEALLDQRNLAGLGTIFTSEPLFMERINPWTPIGELPPERLADVVRRARALLLSSVAAGRPAPTGDPREPTYVFGRRAGLCRRCRGIIRTATVGIAPRDRILAYCPKCQGGLAPGDDGRPQRPFGARRDSRR